MGSFQEDMKNKHLYRYTYLFSQFSFFGVVFMYEMKNKHINLLHKMLHAKKIFYFFYFWWLKDRV